MDKEIKRAKIINYTALAVVCALALAVVVLIVHDKTKPLCDNVTVEKLRSETSGTHDYILTKIADEYYEISASEGFGNIFEFEKWELISDKPIGEICVSLRFAELYILDIYDSGYAAVYDGYAPRGTVSYAYYRISENTADSVISYLRQNGIPHELGDGAIGMGTFSH